MTQKRAWIRVEERETEVFELTEEGEMLGIKDTDYGFDISGSEDGMRMVGDGGNKQRACRAFGR